jgi:hypothetical protein
MAKQTSILVLILPGIILVCRGCGFALTGLGAQYMNFYLDCYFQARKNNVLRDTLISEMSCHGVTNIVYAEADTAGRDPDLIA